MVMFMYTRAFSSEVCSGSREENASKQKHRAPFRFNRNGKRSIIRIARTSALLAILSAGGGCSAIDRLSQIGEAPKLNAIENPTAQPGYKPVQMPMPKPEVASYNANSLWRNGSRAFFKDQRARQIGDLLTVTVNFTDKANIANESQRSRSSKEDSGITDFIAAGTIGAQGRKVLPGRILQTDSASNYDGKGSVVRQENLQTNVAAVVIQILPNGNLVVEGKQEIRVNYEIRELIVAGIVRPEDIQSDNTIDSSKIAQARIAYGGRGQITDFQQPRYGQQVTDIILPF
jgi:flagellar L-ring protein precursor FlgH